MSLSVAALTVGPCDRRPTSSAPSRPSGSSPTSSRAATSRRRSPSSRAKVERGGEGRRPARRDRHRQVRHHGLADRAGAAADARAGPEQDAGGAAGQRVPRAAAAQRRRVLRLVLRLLPARGVHPADRHLHREGLLAQRGGRAAAALGDQLAADPPRRHRRRVGVVHLRPGHPAGVRRPDGPAQGRARRSSATSCCAGSCRCSTPATTSPSRGARSGSAATPSRSSRCTRSSRSASSSSATRSTGSTRCTRSRARSSARRTRCTSSPRRTTSPAPSGWSGRSAASRPSSPTGSPSWSARASCSRPSGCACGRPTTSR